MMLLMPEKERQRHTER